MKLTKKDIDKGAINFVLDAFSTVETHDLRVAEMEIGIDFYDILKEKDMLDEFEGKEMIFGAIIVKIIRNGFIVVKSDKEFNHENVLYRYINEPYNELDYQRFHDVLHPICKICKTIQYNILH